MIRIQKTRCEDTRSLQDKYFACKTGDRLMLAGAASKTQWHTGGQGLRYRVLKRFVNTCHAYHTTNCSYPLKIEVASLSCPRILIMHDAHGEENSTIWYLNARFARAPWRAQFSIHIQLKTSLALSSRLVWSLDRTRAWLWQIKEIKSAPNKPESDASLACHSYFSRHCS